MTLRIPCSLPSPTATLNALLDDPEAPQKVSTMSSVALHRMVSSIGRTDSVDLIAMATAEQVRELLDLDIWHGDRVDLSDALDWLHLIATQLPDEAMAADLRGLDVELMGYVLLRLLRIHLIEEEGIPDELEGVLHQTPDGWFALEVATEDATAAQQTLELVNRLYMLDHDAARRLLHNLTAETPTMLEEWAFRWRNGRLQDLGFADPEQALLIYAYLDPASVRPDEQTADRPLASDPDPVGTTDLARFASQPEESFWSRAVAMLDSPEDQQRVNQALVTLGNRALAADRIDPADYDGATHCLQRLHWRLSLGLEFLCNGDIDRAQQALASVALLRLARLGHSIVLDRRRRVAHAARGGQLGRRPGQVDLLDPPLRGQISSLLASRPQHHDEEGVRPFHDLDDLRRLDACVARALAVARLMLGMELPEPIPDDLTYGDLFRTALVNHLLGLPRMQPVDHAGLVLFLQGYASGCGGGLSPAVLEAAEHAVPDQPEYLELAHLWTETLDAAVSRLGPAASPRVPLPHPAAPRQGREDRHAAPRGREDRDPDGLDLRFVDGLWLRR